MEGTIWKNYGEGRWPPVDGWRAHARMPAMPARHGCLLNFCFIIQKKNTCGSKKEVQPKKIFYGKMHTDLGKKHFAAQ